MFTGRRYDDETSLYYYRARYYSPDIGRFLQTDPVGYIMGLNLYTYVSNNPVNFVDPYGYGHRWDKFKKWVKKWVKKIGSYLPFRIGTTVLEIDLAEDQAQGLRNYRDKV